MRWRSSTLRLRWLLPLAGLLLGGCEFSSAVFLNRGYTTDDLVEEPSLEGRWALAEDAGRSLADDEPVEPALVIERGEPGDACFRVTFHDAFVTDWMIAKPATSARLCAFRISGQTFLDVTRWPEGIDIESMTVGWHWFGALDVSSDELRLRLLHPWLVGEYLEEHPLDLPHVRLDYDGDPQLVVTASPPEIQLFLLLHLGLGDLMDEEYVLQRLPPVEPGAGDGGEESR